jgi:pantothenate synthetase
LLSKLRRKALHCALKEIGIVITGRQALKQKAANILHDPHAAAALTAKLQMAAENKRKRRVERAGREAHQRFVMRMVAELCHISSPNVSLIFS